MGRPVAAARKRLGDGKADPNNPMAKFLAILCRLPRDSKEVSFLPGRGRGLGKWRVGVGCIGGMSIFFHLS